MRGTIAGLADAGRDDVLLGTVRAVEDHAQWGFSLLVDLVDGRPVDARPMFIGTTGRRKAGLYSRPDVGDEVLILCPGGEVNGAIALWGLPSAAAEVPGDLDGRQVITDDLVEVRGDDTTPDGVVLRPLLDDLHEVLTALQSVVTALTSPLTPPGTAVQNAAILTAMRTAADLPLVGLSAKLTSILSALASSRGGRGSAPHCSPHLRATPGA